MSIPLDAHDRGSGMELPPSRPKIFRTSAISGLAMTAFLSSLEASSFSTTLPTIARAVQASEDYLWLVNGYFVARYGHI
jgi:hypothetical protein